MGKDERVLIVLLTRDRPVLFGRQVQNIQSWLNSFPGVAVQVIDNSVGESYATNASSFPVIRTGGQLTYVEVLNTALELALERAQWLVIAHDDDILHPEIVKLIDSSSCNDTVGLVTGRRIFRGFSSSEEQDYYDRITGQMGIPSVSPILGVDLIAKLIDSDNVIPASASAIRLSHLPKSVRFVEQWGYVADYHFWKEFIYRTQVIHGPDLVLTYELDGDRLSKEQGASSRMSALKTLSDCHTLRILPEIRSVERLSRVANDIDFHLDPSRSLDDGLVERLLACRQAIRSMIKLSMGSC